MIYWYEKDKTTAVIKFYADIDWWETNAGNFTSLFEHLDAKYSNVLFRVHCYGGHVIEGNTIFNSIMNAESETVWDIEGACMSMASILMLAAKKRRMASNAILMIHAPSGYANGTAADMDSSAKLLRIMEKNFKKRYKAATGKPEKDVEKWFDGHDHFFDAEEALALGFVDEIIPEVVKDVKDVGIPEPEENVRLSTIYDRYAALYSKEDVQLNEFPKQKSPTGKENPKQPVAKQNSSPIKNDIEMKQLLITMFGLEGVTPESSDTAIANAIQAKISGLETQVTNLETKITDGVKAQTETLVAAVETASGNKFPDAQRKKLLAIGEKSGIESLQMALEFVQPQAKANHDDDDDNGDGKTKTPQIVDYLAKGSNAQNAVAGDRKNWTWADWQEKDSNGLEKMKQDNPKAFNALYKAEYGVNAPTS